MALYEEEQDVAPHLGGGVLLKILTFLSHSVSKKYRYSQLIVQVIFLESHNCIS